MQQTLDIFFSRSFEKEINDKMLEYSYEFPYNIVMDYIHNLISIPYKNYIIYCNQNIYKNRISSSDIPQLSSIDCCTVNMCKSLANANDKGYSLLEIGKLLFKDNKDRNDMAYRKYGENHVKTAKLFGLTQDLYDIWFLTCLGKVFHNLDINNQSSLLARTILREPLFYRVIGRAYENDVDIKAYIGMLSESTQKRRVSSIKQIINICLNEIQKDNINLHNINYST